MTDIRRALQIRSAANRSALTDRLSAAKIDTKVQTTLQNVRKENSARSNGFLPRAVRRELAAYSSNQKPRVLNLCFGNGSRRPGDPGRSWYWTIVSSLSGLRLIWTDTVFPEGGTALPGPSKGDSFEDVTPIIEAGKQYAYKELKYVFGDNVRNVFVELTGTQPLSPEVIVDGDGLWDVTYSLGESNELPLEARESWDVVVPLQANNTNVLSALYDAGVNLDDYSYVFISLAYTFTDPVLDLPPQPGFGARIASLYARAPAVRWQYSFAEPTTALIYSDNPYIPDLNSLPVHNLLTQLDILGAHIDSTGTGYTVTRAEDVKDYSDRELFDLLRKKRRPGNPLIVYGYTDLVTFSAGIQFWPSTEPDEVSTVIPNQGFLSRRTLFNYINQDWALRTEIENKYTDYLVRNIENQTSIVEGFQNSEEFLSTYFPYYSSTLNKTNTRR